MKQAKSSKSTKSSSKGLKKAAKASKKPAKGLKTARDKAKPTSKAPSKPVKAAKPPKGPTKAELAKAQKLKDKEKAAAASAKAAADSRKKALSNPVPAFLETWKVKTETFDQAVERFLREAGVPEKELSIAAVDVIEKLQTQFRKQALSDAIIEQLAERFPKDRIHKMATIFSMKPKVMMRLNFLKADIRGFAEAQAAKDLKMKRGTLSPWSFEVGKIDELLSHPVYERGLVDFQDEASQIMSLFTNARPGHRVLDLCAGDGSNSLAIASMMKNKGSLFIYEADSRKLRRFKERAAMAGVDNFRILSDSQIGEVKSLDVVLVNAPSSHLGDLANKPEQKLKFQTDDLPRLHKLQAALLREGARKLKLGGTLIYATTTLNKSENEGQIENFLKSSHNSYRVVSALGNLKDYIIPYLSNFFGFEWEEKALQSMTEADPFFTLSPDVHGGQGLFIAILQRTRIST
jgi:16S rRNA C967 or C1407 C5-methylase (RsmB/RsmF family)